ncbi:PIG-L deacetylase family protein [Porphyrobacter sp. AAP60]|uniref:PIG-L deacetylase family protein n=1 Tax=Porphyrobacter sp. AAP60 TaxID=1523423 RepID=UPI001F22B1D6|nr:PIG-L family deacetylase [Porphyrobacter sp. AAP60]
MIAPHPDDETLGAGALIHDAGARKRLAGIVYLTDGGGSHPRGTAGLRAVRRREARRAVNLLSATSVPIDWLGWKDGEPCKAGSLRFDRTAMRLAATIRARRIDALAVSDPGDSHCDHIAAFELACETRARSRRKLQIFTYSVWDEPACRGTRFRTLPMPVSLRRRALCAHRSQLSPSMGQGFRLPSPMLRMRAADCVVAVNWPR